MVLRIGDYIVHELENEASKIKSIDQVQPGEKYGTEVSEATLKDPFYECYIFDVEDGHWVRSEQVDIEATKIAWWLQHEAPLEALPKYINDTRYVPILRERLVGDATQSEEAMSLYERSLDSC